MLAHKALIFVELSFSSEILLSAPDWISAKVSMSDSVEAIISSFSVVVANYSWKNEIPTKE